MLKRLFIMSAVTLFASHADAQETGGAIQGRITDPSGAAVPHADVSAVDTATNAAVATRSNAQGDYVLPLLLPGHYNVTANAPGFKTVRREDLELRIHETLQIDLALEVGSPSERVEVTGETPVLENRTRADDHLHQAFRDQFLERKRAKDAERTTYRTIRSLKSFRLPICASTWVIFGIGEGGNQQNRCSF